MSEHFGKALLISGDLFFGSRITGTAERLGFTVDCAAEADQIRERLQQPSYDLVILDLETPGIAAGDLVEMLPDVDRPPVIAFGPHVRTEQLQAARDAGCNEVMPRSRFSSELPGLLKRYLSG